MMDVHRFSTIIDDIYKIINNNRVLTTCAVTSVIGLAVWKRYGVAVMCRSRVQLNNKTVLITGGNTGIGRETARDLASRGARVLLACRDITKGERAAEDIKKSTGNMNVVVYILDLASLKSVRKCAQEVIDKEPRLDVLINNAACDSKDTKKIKHGVKVPDYFVYDCHLASRIDDSVLYDKGVHMIPHWKTEDGFEMIFGTNHLGHFLFTNLLLDLLKNSAPSRIVNVSSGAHHYGKINFDDLNAEKSYNPWTAYIQSKLAIVLFTRELSKRIQGSMVTTNSVHPGLVDTEIARHRHIGLPRWQCALIKCLVLCKGIVAKTAMEGAQTSIYCAVAEELSNVSGKYFRECAVETESVQAQDDETATRLWEVSAELVGLKTS